MHRPFLSSVAIALIVLAAAAVLLTRQGSFGSDPSVYQGTIVLSGNEVLVIEGPFSINGSIVVVGNATLVLRDATVDFLQTRNQQWNITLRDPDDGRPSLSVENASISTDYLMSMFLFGNSSATMVGLNSPQVSVSLHDDSSTAVVNSTLHYTYPMGRSRFEVTGSTISNGYSRGQSTAAYSGVTMEAFWCEAGSAEISESRVDYVGLWIDDANATVNDLVGGQIALFQTGVNMTSEIAPGGQVGDLVLMDSEIISWVFYTLRAANLSISGSELAGLMAVGQTRVTISNCSSALRSYVDAKSQSRVHAVGTSFDSVAARDDSIVWLTESSCSTCQALGNGRILSPAWFLDVHVTDSEDKDVPGASVAAVSPVDPGLPDQMTDASGRVRLVLAEAVREASGTRPAGVYEVTAEWGGYSARSSIEMTDHSELELKLEGLVVGEGGLGPALAAVVGVSPLVRRLGSRHLLSKAIWRARPSVRP